MTVDEELICYRVALLMADVVYQRADDPTKDIKFKTISRRVKMFNEVPANQQPACYQAEWKTTEVKKTNLPYKSTIQLFWIVYQCVAQNDKAIGGIENNLILRGVRAALAPKPTDPGYPDQRNTLDGLVYDLKIDGDIFKDPGDIDGQGMLSIPIKVLVP